MDEEEQHRHAGVRRQVDVARRRVDVHQRHREQREEREMQRDTEEPPEEHGHGEERCERDEARRLDVSGQPPDRALQQLAQEREALEARLVVGAEGIRRRIHDAGQPGREGQVVVPDVVGLRDIAPPCDEERERERERDTTQHEIEPLLESCPDPRSHHP
jgi:hypothetical protein